MSEGPPGPTGTAMTHGRAAGLALFWVLGGVILVFGIPLVFRIPFIGPLASIGLLISPFLVLLGAAWTHRSWKVILWVVLFLCASVVLLPVVWVIIFNLVAGHPG